MALERSRDKVSKAVFDLEPTAIIELYRIYPNTITKPKTYFNIHNGSVFGGGVIWQGETYSPVPMETEGFSIDSTGKPNRPIMRISNKDLLITNLLANNEDFRNAKIERRRTFLKYLDEENFDSANPFGEPDPNAEISVDVYYVSQKRQENKVFVEFELTNPLDIESRDLTNRKILAKFCPWNYRGTGCQYKGKTVEREDGKPFTFGKRNDTKNNKIIKGGNIGATSRNLAINDKRSFVDMENYGETFVYANPNDLYNPGIAYKPGHIVYTLNERIKIQDPVNPGLSYPTLTYFVCRNPTKGRDPRKHPDYWDKDGCGKKLHQCKSRFAKSESQVIYLQTDRYEQQMWNIQGYDSGVHQSYLRPVGNGTETNNAIKNLLRYDKKRWGYPHPAGDYVLYEDLYDNWFYKNNSTVNECTTNSNNEWLTTNNTDLDKEFTILVDIERLGPAQRYTFYPPALAGVEDPEDLTEEIIEAAEEDVDQIIFKTSAEKVGYYAGHKQLVLGVQKEPYLEFRTFRPFEDETNCKGKVNRVKLFGGAEEGDYLIVRNELGQPGIPEAGFDVKNSRNFVISLRKDVHEGRARFRANWSCLTYPENEETDTVYIECQTTFYVKNIISNDVDRLVFFGGTTQMPVNDDTAGGSGIKDISSFNAEPTSYTTEWSQQEMQVAAVAVWDKALTNGQLNSVKATQSVAEGGSNYVVQLVKTWDTISAEDPLVVAEDQVLPSCLSFWQEPYIQDGIWYVKDHKNANDLIYKDSNYEWAGGEANNSYTKPEYDFLALTTIATRTPNVGGEQLIEGEFGTLPFGGFPGTDGYRFQI